MATAFNRVRYLYNLGASDTASFDVTVAGDSPGGLITSYLDLLTYAEHLQTNYTLGGSPDPYQGLKAALSEQDALVGVNAQYVVGTQVVGSAYAQLGTPEAGTGTNRMPFEVSWVASLRTDEAGRSARGRCYFPATGITCNANGTISVPSTTLFADSFGNLLADVAAGHTDPTAQVQVYSRTLDRMLPVTRVLVDSTPDTQRRRGNKLQSPYQTSSTYPV
jgi:hypothetical protein